MSVLVHMVQVFAVPAEGADGQCDALMADLINLEGTDRSVRDAAVSLDKRTRRVTVEVDAAGADRVDAEAKALARIRAVVTSHAGIATVDEVSGTRRVDSVGLA